MKTIMLLLAALFGLQQTAFPQEEPPEQRRAAIALELGYYSPSKESFRTNYDQSLFVSSAGVPVSLGIEFDYSLSPRVDLFLGLRRINHALKSNRDISLTLMPATLGIHYILPKSIADLSAWKPYLASGLEFYWSRFSATYLLTQTDPTPIREVSETDNYFGYGIAFGLGIEHPLGRTLTSGFGVTYDINRLGSSDEGGLGNVGGFLFSAKLGITL